MHTTSSHPGVNEAHPDEIVVIHNGDFSGEAYLRAWFKDCNVEKTDKGMFIEVRLDGKSFLRLCKFIVQTQLVCGIETFLDNFLHRK